MKNIKFEDLKLTAKEMKELVEGARRFVYIDEVGPELSAEELRALTAQAAEDTV